MAARADESSYVAATVREILDLVRNGGRNGAPDTQLPAAVIDPTKNVSDQLNAAVKRLDDIMGLDRSWAEKLRVSDLAWGAKLDAQRDRADTEARKAESGRIDALRAADAANVAIAVAQVTEAAKALAIAAAATKDVQDKQIVALQLVASSSGGTLAGREVQRTEGRQTNQWAVGLIVFGGLTLLGLIATVIALIQRLP